MTRVTSLASHKSFVSRIMNIQKDVFKSQTQLYSEMKTSYYSEISNDTSRLINMENERDRAKKFISNNQNAELRLETMGLSVSSVETTIRDFTDQIQQFASRDLPNLGVKDDADIKTLQTAAFNAMQDIEYFLNQKVDSRYLFGGGKTDTAPVQIGFNNLDQFQATYNGEEVTFPETKAAHFSNFSVNDTATGGVTIQQTGAETGTITAANAGAFVLDTLEGSANTTGDLTFDAVGDTIRAAVPGAFSHIDIGDTLIIDGATGGNNGPKYITGVSADGRTLTLDSASPLAVNETIADGAGVTVSRTWPIGSDIDLSNINPAYDGAYTITGINSNQEIEVKTTGFPAGATNYPPTGSQVIRSSSYYQGDQHDVEHRVSESRVMAVGVNAQDGAFEKALRALGMVAQGNLYDPTGTDTLRGEKRIEKALELLEDSISHRNSVNEDPSDLVNLYYKVDMNRTTVENTMDRQREMINFLETRVSSIEGVDTMQAGAELSQHLKTLEISYSVLGRTSKLSLLSFL